MLLCRSIANYHRSNQRMEIQSNFKVNRTFLVITMMNFVIPKLLIQLKYLMETMQMDQSIEALKLRLLIKIGRIKAD